MLLEYTRKIENLRSSRKEKYYIYFGNASRLSTSVSLVALFAISCVKRITDVHAIQHVPKLDVSQDFFFLGIEVSFIVTFQRDVIFE